jgi:hypothetical protein
MKWPIVTTLLLFFYLPLKGQEFPKFPETRRIYIYQEDSTIIAEVLGRMDNVKDPLNDKTYYWYAFDRIHCNEGGWSGNLLHGSFQVFNVQNDLIEEGQFEKGLKQGDWFFWNADGTIKQKTEWEDGEKSRMIEYEAGKLVKEISYKNGMLHGKTIFYKDGNVVDVVKYNDGQIIEKKKKDEQWFLSRWLRKWKQRENKDSVPPVLENPEGDLAE